MDQPEVYHSGTVYPIHSPAPTLTVKTLFDANDPVVEFEENTGIPVNGYFDGCSVTNTRESMCSE